MTGTATDSGRRTFLLVDGENIDATLGTLLGHRPSPDERPRWDRVSSYVAEQWRQPVTGLFFLNASLTMPSSFVQALLAMRYRPVPLAGRADQKVVDLGILRTLEALAERPDADVALISHDADFAAHLGTLVEDGRRVGVLGFREFSSTQLDREGIEHFDLEQDVGAFNTELPRVRVIPVDEFDPTWFLR